jgi:hypothetical protein
MDKVIARMNKLNSLVSTANQVYETIWNIDYKDTTGEFNEELRQIMDACTAIEDRIMKESKEIKQLINKLN